MKKALIAPPKPTKDELKKLGNYFYLPDWQFGTLIGNKCTEISKTIIKWKKGDNQEAIIYGLKAIRIDTQKGCIANFFVHYESRVYQCYYIENAVEIIRLLKKDLEYDEYEHKLWQQRNEAREKAKVKKLKPVIAKVA